MRLMDAAKKHLEDKEKKRTDRENKLKESYFKYTKKRLNRDLKGKYPINLVRYVWDNGWYALVEVDGHHFAGRPNELHIVMTCPNKEHSPDFRRMVWEEDNVLEDIAQEYRQHTCSMCGSRYTEDE